MNRDVIITKALELFADAQKQKNLYTTLRVAGISVSCILTVIGVLSGIFLTTPHNAEGITCCYGNCHTNCYSDCYKNCYSDNCC